MKKKQKKSFRKAIFIIVVSFVAAIVIPSFAIYTNQGYKKGVAITAKNIAMFSSNLLEQLPETTITNQEIYALKDTTVQTVGEKVSASFSIYNYAPNTPTRINSSDITYTLNISIKDFDTNMNVSDYTIAVEGSESENVFDVTGSSQFTDQKLTRDQISSCSYSITMPSDALEQHVQFVITAVPSDSLSQNAVNHTCLAAIVTPVSAQSGEAPVNNSWSGYWVEKQLSVTTLTELKPSDCQAFNCEISGIGSGMLTMTWPSALAVDSDFVTFLNEKENSYTGPVLDENGNFTMTIAVDEEKWNVYTIRFYRTGEEFPSEYSATDFNKWTVNPVTFVPSST